MKRVIAVLAAGFLGVAMPAHSADYGLRRSLSADAPINGNPDDSWRGSYLGLEGGWAWGSSPHQYSNGAPSNTSRIEGISGGLFGGYNLRFGQFVAGAEGDIGVGDIHGAYTDTTGITSVGDARVRWDSALRARFGYVFDHFLLYGAAGVAAAQIRFVGGPAPFQTCCGFTRLKAGYTIGVGTEYAINPFLIGRAEYRFTDFGRVSGALVPTQSNVTLRSGAQLNEVRVGVSYKFGE